MVQLAGLMSLCALVATCCDFKPCQKLQLPCLSRSARDYLLLRDRPPVDPGTVGGIVRRTVITGSAIAGLMAAMLTPYAANASEETAAQARSLDPSVLAEGKVSRGAGKMAAGIPVVLYAWPGNDVTDKLVVGDEVKLQQLSETAAGADGSFQLRLNDLEALVPVTGTDQIVNFEVVAGEGESAVPFAFARKVRKSPTGTTLVDAVSEPRNPGQPAPPPLLKIDLTTGGIVETNPGAAPVVAPDATDEPVETGFSKACTAQLLQDYGPSWVIVGQHYNEATQVFTDFVYGRGAVSELGVGFSASGKYGSFKLSGSLAKSTSMTIDYPAVGDYQSRYRYSQFKYGKYRVACTRPGGIPVPYYEARVTTWAGGSKSAVPSAGIGSGHCAPYEQGSNVELDRSRAVTWSNGAQVGGDVGIDLSARTGYTTNSKLKWGFNRARKLCGSHGLPGEQPQTLTTKF
ncbi:hypothetical protein ACFTSF_15565 [Kribbella sp. NPDC056951]|uniref:hypothetical protein n=1 Tax=Kribbella sp. NPDC056951 TaxID=3345978 RepID=UPI00363AF2BF